ncbi:MAG: hypothetical protein VW124_12795 [Paracoccaceae bacterium]
MKIDRFNSHRDFLGFVYDRTESFHDTADDLYNHINNFTDRDELLNLYNYFEKAYGLPAYVTKQKIRQHLGRSYLFKEQKFKPRLRLSRIPIYVALYGALFYALFFAKRKSKHRTYSLIIDNIQHPIELSRFEKLLNLFGRENVLCISREVDVSADFPNYNLLTTRLFRNFNVKDVFHSIYSEVFGGIWTVFKASFNTRVNLFPIALQIVHSYLNFKSIFELNSAKYIIQERHYDTNSVKNYLFKRYGGVCSATIQKNIFQNDPINWYLDIDILLSLGQTGYEDMLSYGGVARSVNPVGSMFMEALWFDRNISTENAFDVVIIGINTANEYGRLDSFSEFMDDYYSLARWCAKLSTERPHYRIALIHHASGRKDLIETEILEGSNVQVLDKTLNSYEMAFSSKCAVTYGSTMGYELNAHGLDTFFVDPGFRCTFLPRSRNPVVDKMRLKSYDDFVSVVDAVVLDGHSFVSESERLAWAIESSDVATTIFNVLHAQSD